MLTDNSSIKCTLNKTKYFNDKVIKKEWSLCSDSKITEIVFLKPDAIVEVNITTNGKSYNDYSIEYIDEYIKNFQKLKLEVIKEYDKHKQLQDIKNKSI
jgi:hypothetical protein